jgi:hypothetical protein
VAAQDVQESLRSLFERFGLPERIRVDNGAPWASWSDVPTALALWWIGLGIQVIFNHVHCPKENAFVERCNGLVDAWGDPARCADFATWEQSCTWLASTQREVYPAKHGKTRLEVFPGLCQNARSYSKEQENQQWHLQQVYDYLAKGLWPRLVSKIGQITVYGKPYRVGRAYVHQQVFLRLDAATGEWIIQDANGHEIIRHPAQQITTERICGLSVSQARPPSRRGKHLNLPAAT